MVRIPEYRTEGIAVRVQDVDVRALEFRGVVRDALHQYEVFVAGLLDDAHRLVHLGQGRGTGSKHYGLSLFRDVLHHLEPCDIARTYFVEFRPDFFHQVNGLVVIWSRRRRYPDLPAVFEERLVPLARKLNLLENFVDGPLP